MLTRTDMLRTTDMGRVTDTGQATATLMLIVAAATIRLAAATFGPVTVGPIAVASACTVGSDMPATARGSVGAVVHVDRDVAGAVDTAAQVTDVVVVAGAAGPGSATDTAVAAGTANLDVAAAVMVVSDVVVVAAAAVIAASANRDAAALEATMAWWDSQCMGAINDSVVVAFAVVVAVMAVVMVAGLAASDTTPAATIAERAPFGRRSRTAKSLRPL